MEGHLFTVTTACVIKRSVLTFRHSHSFLCRFNFILVMYQGFILVTYLFNCKKFHWCWYRLILLFWIILTLTLKTWQFFLLRPQVQFFFIPLKCFKIQCNSIMEYVDLYHNIWNTVSMTLVKHTLLHLLTPGYSLLYIKSLSGQRSLDVFSSHQWHTLWIKFGV